MLCLHRLLAELQSAAAKLPELEPFNIIARDGSDDHLARYRAIYEKLTTLPFSKYHLVFNALDDAKPVPVTTNIQDDLADIYIDLEDGIEIANTGFENDALWTWRFSYYSHWGRHAVHAQTAIWQYLAENPGEF